MRADCIRPARETDWPAIQRLLTILGLPLADAEKYLDSFIVADDEGVIAGCAAIERHGKHALLRSVAVDPARRGLGIGERMVRRLVAEAETQGLESVALLTTSAQNWFPRFGFSVVRREDVAPALTNSVEFRGACPSTAVAMSLLIGS